MQCRLSDYYDKVTPFKCRKMLWILLPARAVRRPRSASGRRGRLIDAEQNVIETRCRKEERKANKKPGYRRV